MKINNNNKINLPRFFTLNSVSIKIKTDNIPKEFIDENNPDGIIKGT